MKEDVRKDGFYLVKSLDGGQYRLDWMFSHEGILYDFYEYNGRNRYIQTKRQPKDLEVLIDSYKK